MPATRAVPQTVVLFEGRSDSLAFRALARRRAVRLDRHGLVLIDLDGITNLRRALTGLRDADASARLLGLYDAAESAYVIRVLADLGMLGDARADPVDIGFFGCERDLEDEVIRAAGVQLTLQTLEARGELARFRVFGDQPAQRERSIEEQLHRFAGTAAGRKARFAADVIEVLPPERAPRPLARLLEAVDAVGGGATPVR